MSIDFSKLCADHLRQYVLTSSANKLKASHARELVAAFFGYQSHAALLSDQTFPLSRLSKAGILVPDVPMIERRLGDLHGLPDLPWPLEIARVMSEFLKTGTPFTGEVWVYESLEGYLADVWLRENDASLMDELSGVMAETNAEFTDFPDYEGLELVDSGERLNITIYARYSGDQLDDKPYCGHEISFQALLTLTRVASKRSFLDYQLDVRSHSVRDW